MPAACRTIPTEPATVRELTATCRLDLGWKTEKNRPIFNITARIAVAEKRYSSPVGKAFLQEEGPRFRLRSWQVSREQSPYTTRLFLSHFLPSRTTSKTTGRATAGRSCCADARFVSANRLSVTVAAASRHTMNTTTGLGSDGGFASVVGGPSPSSRCSLFHIPITACWLALRRSGDVL